MNFNAEVRAERGGAQAARVRTEALKRQPALVTRYCEALLAGPMSDATLEALIAVMEWRQDREVPRYQTRRRRAA